MAEKRTPDHETTPRSEAVEQLTGGEKNSAEHTPALVIDEIRQEIAHEALRADQTKHKSHEAVHHPPSVSYGNAELKKIAYKRALKHARQQLRPDQMLFSEFMHLPPVEATAEIVSKTIGRPSGLLGSGVITLSGSLGYYYITKHYGYDYNFGVFLILSAIGFLAGWTAELSWRLMRR